MKNLLAAIIFIILCFAISEKVAAKNGNTKSLQNLPVIDKTKRYPKKAFDRKVDETYILLETRNDILLDKDAHVYYVSDNRMLFVNRQVGDVFIFDTNGKAISRFNEKGRDGYSWINYALYDEPNSEVFIVDNISKRIFVFSEDGARKRTLHFPRSMHIEEINNFDANTMLAFHEHQHGPLHHEQPYFFISKKDGSIISYLNIKTNKVNPRRLSIYNSANNSMTSHTIMSNFSGSCKFGAEFILANMSSDTIYLLKQDKTIRPLFVQSPSVFSEPPIITYVRMKTDDFVTFSLSSYDLRKGRRNYESGKEQNNPNPRVKHLMYEFKTGQFFELENNYYTADKVDMPANTSVAVFHPHNLKIWLNNGRLDGELKEIAKKIDVNDNPVIGLVKIK